MITFPENPKELVQKSKTDVQNELPESNPFLKNSFLGAAVTANAIRVFDFYIQLKQLIKALFIQTTSGEFLKMFGAWFGLTVNPATPAAGRIVATGTAATNIPLGTSFQSSDGLQYQSTLSTTIAATVLSVASITRSGSTATVTTVADHLLANGVSVTIAGANETEYNGSFSILVTGAKTFTYTVTGTPASPATGTITAAHTSASVPVQSVDFGADLNQLAGAILSLTSPIAGVDNSLTVDFGELSGGSDVETDDSFRDKVIDRVQNPVANFNVAAIRAKAFEVSGVTRVFVQPVTPAVGQVTIYFLRDNDEDPIPSALEVTEVKNKILEIKPVVTADVDVIVAAPTPITVDFTFTALDPDTTTMQNAITTSLDELFQTLEVGVILTKDQYRAAIQNTIDRETGDIVKSFTLSNPVADVSVAVNELPVLGTVSF